jgi:peptidase inhibitor I78 family protein
MKRLATAMLMAMTGCATVPPAEAEDRPMQDQSGGKCDAAPAQGLVGKARSRAVAAEAKRLSGARALRWIPEGAMVTMDYREDRLNLHLDGRNKVVKIACG